MRYVAIEKAKDNMVLAMPIYDSINRVLLATGTIMTRDYIRKLKARGLPGFYVEDELAKDIEVQDIVTQELRNEGVEALQRGDLDACMKVAEQIVEQILSRPPIRLDMIDLRILPVSCPVRFRRMYPHHLRSCAPCSASSAPVN